MERGSAGVHEQVIERYLAVDEQGVGLRATWRSASAFTNVSLWRGNVCIETFHLGPEQMGDLVAFLATNLGSAYAASPRLRVVAEAESAAPKANPLSDSFRRARAAAARSLQSAARRIGP